MPMRLLQGNLRSVVNRTKNKSGKSVGNSTSGNASSRTTSGKKRGETMQK